MYKYKFIRLYRSVKAEVVKLATKKKRISGKTIFNIIVFGLCGFMVLYFCFSKGGLIELINSSQHIDVFWLMLAISAHLLNIVLDSVLLYRFLSRSSKGVKLTHSIKAAMAGQFFCAVTPSSTGGQPMQIMILSHYGIDAGKATSALVQKFLVWQFTLTGYTIAVILLRFNFFAERLSPFLWVMSAIGFVVQAAMIFVLILVSFSHKITFRLISWLCRLGAKIRLIKNPDETIDKIEQQLVYFHNSNKEFSKHKGFIAVNYILTIIQMTAIYVVPYCVYRALSPESQISVGVFDIISAQSFVNMVSSLVPLPGASGAAELSFAGFFNGIFDDTTMKSAILIWRTITYYGTIFISAPFSGMGKKEVSNLAKETQEEIKDDFNDKEEVGE